MDPQDRTSPPPAPPPPASGTAATLPRTPRAQYEAQVENLKSLTSIDLRYPLLQRICAPKSGRLWAIGGRPGNFKTALVWNLALNAATDQRVLMVGLEVTPGELGLLALSRYTKIPVRRLEAAYERRGTAFFTLEESARVQAGLKYLDSLAMNLRLHGPDQGRTLKSVIESACQHRYDAIFIDHVGMIGRAVSPAQELEVLAVTIEKLRALSDGEMKTGYTPFVCFTTHLNRESERHQRRGEYEPIMGDFRGSSRIESDVDCGIILVKHSNADNPEATPKYVDARIVKNRHGPSPFCVRLEAEPAICLVREREPEAPKEDAK